jgi:ABC-type dipeptide/oligopeptide/nickel transport system permease component
VVLRRRLPGLGRRHPAGLRALLLPALSLAVVQSAILARITRSAVLEVLREDFVRTARAKGVSQRGALWGHVLRNAMIPVVTVMGLQFAELLAGTIVVESVFYLPGLGRLIFQSISNRDLIVVRNCVMLLAAMVVIVNFVVDLLYAVIDPRVKAATYERRARRSRRGAGRKAPGFWKRAAASQLRDRAGAEPAAGAGRRAVAGVDAAFALRRSTWRQAAAAGRQLLAGHRPFGRDVVSLLLVGARASIVVGVIAVGIGLLIGTALGLLASARRGWVEEVIMRCRLRLRLPGHPVGHHADGGVRPGHGQRHHRDRHLQHPDLRAHHARLGQRRLVARVRAGGARLRQGRFASRSSTCCPTSCRC